MSARMRWLPTLALLLVVVLAGCTGLPASGPVNAGNSAASDGQPAFDFRPDGPQPGASPQQIVTGFITAASSPEGNWAIAQSFLASGYRSAWQPQAGVVVDVFSDRQYAVAEDGTVTLTVAPAATVSAGGGYTAEEQGTTSLTYRLTQENGQWRIVEAPAGLLMDQDLFANVFHPYPVMYFDATWTHLVPDLRWFPTLNAPSRVANALVNGAPSEWLAASVSTAFPENVKLTPSVPVTGTGVAEVELSEQALTLDDATLDRMQTQLQASLQSAGVTSVQMLVDGTALDASVLPLTPPAVDRRALVLTAQGFGFLVSGELTAIPGLSDVVQKLAPTAIETSPDRSAAAVQLADGTIARAQADGASAVVDTRAGLVKPTIDPSGTIWTVPQGSPTEVRAIPASGDAVAIRGAWSGAARIAAMQISRDGARMAAILTFGGRSVVAVAGVVRDARGVPTALGEPEVLATLPDGGIDVAWADEVTLGVLTGAAEPAYVDVPVGGPAESIAAPAGAHTLAGSSSTAGVRVLSSDGILYLRRSSTWVQSATGVSVLAVQQGAPASG